MAITPETTWPATFNIGTYGLGKVSYLPTLIGFGTDGILTGIIVKDIRAIPMVEEIKIEAGSGLTATQIILNDGDEVEITVVDDRSITWAQPGGTISVTNPQPNGTSGTIETYQVINNNYSIARKAEGTRTILGKHYALFAPVVQ
jgi:hypothetical protein